MKVQVMLTRIKKTNKKFQPENIILAPSKAGQDNLLTVHQFRRINRNENKIHKTKNQ